MANSAPIFVGQPRNEGVKLSTNATNVDGASSTLLFQADPTNGSRIHSLSAVPTGALTSPVVVRFFLENGSTYWIIGEKTLPGYTVTSGVGAPTTSFLEYGDLPFLDPADRFLSLGPGDSLYVALLDVPDNPVHFICCGGDY